MARVRTVLNRRALRELLRSDEVVSNLRPRGERIAAAAGTGHQVQTYKGRNRARVTVRTETFRAMQREASRRSLTRAFNAGR